MPPPQSSLRPVAVALRSDRCKPSAHPRTRMPCKLPRGLSAAAALLHVPGCVCRALVSHTTACAESKFSLSLRCPPQCTVALLCHVCEPCLQSLLLTREMVTAQFLIRGQPPNTQPSYNLQAGSCSAANDIIRLESSPLIGLWRGL